MSSYFGSSELLIWKQAHPMERIRAPVGYQGGNWELRATGGAARACGDIDDGVARDGQAMRVEHEIVQKRRV